MLTGGYDEEDEGEGVKDIAHAAGLVWADFFGGGSCAQ